MSKKKKTAQMPKIPATDLDTRIGVTRLDDIYGPNRMRGGAQELDPLAELEREETRDAVNELRELRRQKKMLEYRRRVSKLKEEVGAEDTMDGGLSIKGLFNFSNQDLQGISQMPPEERQAFLDTVKEISIMSASVPRSGKGMSPMMQLAAMGGFGGRGQQGLTAKDVIDLQQTMNQIYQSAGTRDGGRELTLKLLTETIPAYQTQSMQNMKYAYDTQLKALRDQITDPIKDMRYIKEAAGLMGMTTGTQDREVSLARMQMEDRWKLEEFKIRREELTASKMLGTVEQILKNVDIPSVTRAFMRQQVSDKLKPQPQASPPSALPQGEDQIVEYTCPNCKGVDGAPTKIYAPASQGQVTCQNCGGIYPVKPGSVKQP